MRKTKRIILAFAVALILSSLVATSVSAYTISQTGIGSFEWYLYNDKITNISNSQRRVEVFINVYEDNTGVYVQGLSSTNTGTYGAYASKSHNYSPTQYNFKYWGRVYNGTAYQSGTAWYTGEKNLT